MQEMFYKFLDIIIKLNYISLFNQVERQSPEGIENTPQKCQIVGFVFTISFVRSLPDTNSRFESHHVPDERCNKSVTGKEALRTTTV